jgi:predicted RNA-binding Zn ribbon-like protein
MNSDKYDLEAGALCLNLANTVDWHASDQSEDMLGGYADLIEWGQAAEILSAAQAERLRQIAASHPENAAAAYDKVVQTREAIYRIFADFSERGNVNQDDLAILNEVLRQSLSHLQIAPSLSGFAWGWAEGADDLDYILWVAARSAGELLTSDTLDRVRQCADDRGCGYLFIDTSRNRSRRWCSMESCGNRAKARRHYQRQIS